MGFALWIDGDLAWAQGTHEYRPMGAAVISRYGVFSPRDFRPHLRAPYGHSREFAGFFASLGDLNRFLKSCESRRKPYNGMAIL